MDDDPDDAVQKIEFELPEGIRVTGQYVGEFQSGQNIKAIETPDGLNVIHVKMRSSRLLLTNPNDVDFSFDLIVMVAGSKKNWPNFDTIVMINFSMSTITG